MARRRWWALTFCAGHGAFHVGRDISPTAEGISMKVKRAIVISLILSPLLGSVVLAQDSDTDRDHPKTFVKDSGITAKIKAKLAAEHITSLGRIRVDTDKDGVVWMRGTTRTEEAADKAVEIARNTEGVTSVKSDIRVKPDD
jgi:hyperosmotically inducible periplasmic protein